MKLKEYLRDLTKLYEEHGDMDLVYSSDDEGNCYYWNGYSPSVGNYDGEGGFKNEECYKECLTDDFECEADDEEFLNKFYDLCDLCLPGKEHDIELEKLVNEYIKKYPFKINCVCLN